MSKYFTTARHRATPDRSIALQGLAVTAKAQARTLGRPALAVAAASGIAFGIGAPAHAGVTGPDTTSTTNVQAYSAPAAPAAAAPAAAAGSVHTVVSGDTLGAIASAYGVSLNDVLAANGLNLSSIIYPGDQIAIPGAGYAAPAVAPAAAPVQTASTAPANTGMNLGYASATPAATGTGTGAAILANAYSQVGVTQDCTAMVEKALRAVGKSVGDLAPGQFFQYGTVVGTPAPGDLVISAGHVGVYAGDGQMVSGGVNGSQTQVHPVSWVGAASYVRVA